MPQLPLKTTLGVLMVCAWASDPAILSAEEPMQVDLVQDLHWQNHHFAMTNWFYNYKWSEAALPCCFVPKNLDTGLELYAKGGNARIRSLKVSKLRSIWDDNATALQ